jgi:Ca2+-binding RTX toxin-like protein
MSGTTQTVVTQAQL